MFAFKVIVVDATLRMYAPAGMLVPEAVCPAETPLVDANGRMLPLAVDALVASEDEPYTSPCATVVVPAELVHRRQYPAVPVADAAAAVIEFMVSTPADTVPAVDDNASDASKVPVADAAQFAGTEPE
jgi:hypothetical protein